MAKRQTKIATREICRAEGGRLPPVGESDEATEAERRCVAETLRESEERYRAFIETAGKAGQGIGIFQDRDETEAVCIFANDAFGRLLGFTEDSLLGRPMSSLIPADIRGTFIERYRRRQRGESVLVVYEAEVKRADREPIFIEVRVGVTTYQCKPASVAFIRDVTERRWTEDALKRRLEFERAVSNISSRFVGRLDINQSVTDSLADIGRVTGADRAYLFLLRENGTIIDNTHEWCAEGVVPQIESLQNVPCEAFQWWLQRMRGREVMHIPDVSQMPAEAAAERELVESQGIKSFVLVPVSIGVELGGMIGLDNVSTNVPWSEDDLTILRMSGEIIGSALARARAERAETEARALRELDRLRRQLLANVSHELRTPLTTIKGYTTMLLEDDTTSNPDLVRRHLQNVIRAADQLTELVDDLVDMSRMERGVFKLQMGPCDVSELLRTAAYEAQVRAPKHRVRAEFPPVLPRVSADPTRLRQVMDNLLNNAVKYSGEGTEIAVSAQQRGQALVISVADQGIGIASKDLPRVFDPLFRVGRRMPSFSSGDGLGLSICKGLVEAQGGEIWIESEEGKGTVCSFTLRVCVEETDSR